MRERPDSIESRAGPVLVTGGCGFVGRHLVKRLLEMGRLVWIVDDLSTGRHPDLWVPKQYAAQVVFVPLEAREFFRLHGGSSIQEIPDLPSIPNFEDVFHLAAVVGGRAKIEGDPMAVAQDLAIDASFFLWAIKVRPRRVLYASSSAAYPIHFQTPENYRPLEEDFITFRDSIGIPDMTYGWAKLTGEYLARLAASHYALHVACIRPFSGYGEDQDLDYPIPAIAARVARREDPLVLWGSGKQARDFVYIEDCIDAMVLTLSRLKDGSAVNIGSGRLTTFVEVAEKLAGIAHYSPRIAPLADRPSGVALRCASTVRSAQLLGWRPKISLEEGLRRAFRAAELRKQEQEVR